MKPQPYGPFPYVPITRRPKFNWPDGGRVAIWVMDHPVNCWALMPAIQLFVTKRHKPLSAGAGRRD